MVRADECWNITADAAGQDASKCRLAQMLGSPSCAPPQACNVICFTDTAPRSCRFVAGASILAASTRGLHMTQKIKIDRYDFVLALAVVAFAVVAISLVLT